MLDDVDSVDVVVVVVDVVVVVGGGNDEDEVDNDEVVEVEVIVSIIILPCLISPLLLLIALIKRRKGKIETENDSLLIFLFEYLNIYRLKVASFLLFQTVNFLLLKKNSGQYFGLQKLK